MLWLLLALALLITPLQLSVLVSHTSRTEGRFLLRVWGIPYCIRFRVEQTSQGHQLVLGGKSMHAVQPESNQLHSAMVFLGAFLRSDKARRFVFRHVHLKDLSVALQLCLSNAARTAMLTGAVRSAYAMLPPSWRKRVHLQAAPDFLHADSSVHLRCILFTRLGTLVITAAMLLAAWMLERREHRPKEENA